MTAFLCALPLLANLMSACVDPGNVAVGYVEGEYVLAPPAKITTPARW